MKKKMLLSMSLATVIFMTTTVNAFAMELVPDELNENFHYEEISKQNIDYATVVQFLDIEDLANYSEEIQKEFQGYSEDELNNLLKAKIMQEGTKLNVISTTREIKPFNLGVSPYSYGDLPVVKNSLGKNEKKVFNESLIKGIAVLSAGKMAMSYYNSYYYGGEDDNADAFRHSLWMALSSASVAGKDYSRRFGIAHEDDRPSSALARSMDLYNNNVGISYGPYLSGYAGYADLFYSMALSTIDTAVKNGEMKRFKGSDIGTLTYLVNTNSSGARR